MPATTTLTIRLPGETKEKLALLAEKTRRSSSFLAGDAIADYVARELAIVAKIDAARARVRAGRFTTHDDVMTEALKITETAQSKP